jgi:hypothetical protein
MAGTLKKVRFKSAWQGYRVGDEITPNGTLRDWLISNGYADLVDEPSPVRKQGVNRQAAPTSRRGR